MGNEGSFTNNRNNVKGIKGGNVFFRFPLSLPGMSRQHTIAISPEFKFLFLYPEGLLSSYVSLMWASEGTPPYVQERIVPDGACVLILNFGQPVASSTKNTQKDIKKTFFAGVFTHHSDLYYPPGAGVHRQMGVIFKPAGAYPFVQIPLSAFKNTALETEAFENGQFDEWHDQLSHISALDQRLYCLEGLLQRTLARNYDATLAPTLVNLIRNNPQWRMDELVKKTGYSQQHLNRILGKYAGLNAKALQRIFRMQAAMTAIWETGTAENLTDIGYRLDYFDQAHFIHDFNEMTGLSPKNYLQLPQPATNRVLYL